MYKIRLKNVKLLKFIFLLMASILPCNFLVYSLLLKLTFLILMHFVIRFLSFLASELCSVSMIHAIDALLFCLTWKCNFQVCKKNTFSGILFLVHGVLLCFILPICEIHSNHIILLFILHEIIFFWALRKSCAPNGMLMTQIILLGYFFVELTRLWFYWAASSLFLFLFYEGSVLMGTLLGLFQEFVEWNSFSSSLTCSTPCLCI